MRTIVYQSFRGDETPIWIQKCMQTVKDWAQLKGFDYQREDNFFDYVPDWYLDKAQGKISLIADLARLNLAKKFLTQGYEQTIWVDADMVIFAPDNLTIDTTENCLLCREVWLGTKQDNDSEEQTLSCYERVTNSILFFTKDNSFLDFYIYACESIMKNQPDEYSHLVVSTKFLSDLYEIVELPLFYHVGLFSPLLIQGLVEEKAKVIQFYAKSLKSPIYAANLCFSFRNQVFRGVLMSDKLFEDATDKLISTKGETLNRLVNVSSG